MPSPSKDLRDDAQHFNAAVFDCDLRLRHGGQADEASDLDHVGQEGVLRSLQFFTPSMISMFDPMPLIFAPMRLSMMHSCWR